MHQLRVMPWIVLFAIIGSGWQGARAQPPEPGQAQERQRALEELRVYLDKCGSEGFSGVVMVFRDETPVLERSFGFADRDRTRPIRPEMVFDLGSITKCVTGAAVLFLEAEGKLAREDTLKKYFPGAPPDKAIITVDQLLRHTSGLEQIFGADEDYVTDAWVTARAMESVLISAPGEKRNYSDVGYSLLAMIVERVSGKPFEAFVQDRVLRPAGLSRTGYTSPDWKADDLVCGFLDGKPWGTTRDFHGPDGPSWNVRGNGAMLSTASELAQWWDAVLKGRVLPPREADLLVKFYSGTSRATGHHVLSCSGNNKIFSSFYRRWLDGPHGVTLVLLTNSSDWPYERDGFVPRLIELIGRYTDPPSPENPAVPVPAGR